MTESLEEQIDQLDVNGYLLVPGALDEATVQAWRQMLYERHRTREYDLHTNVGNYVYEYLLEEEPALARPLVGHASVAPYLRTMLGRQCQLRSFRVHLNPYDYTQEWHLDFYDYWSQRQQGRHAVQAMCMNTTFYLTDNTPDRGRLTFIHEYFNRPVPQDIWQHAGYTDDRDNPFQKWCSDQPHVNLHPNAGDAVVFFSHIPHQGAKLGDDPDGPIRCNVVCHYQTNPMYPGIHFVSRPNHTLSTLGYDGTFPFCDDQGGG